MDVLISEVWSSSVNDFFRAKLVCADFFENWSDDLSNGGDVIHRPNVTEMSSGTKSNGTAVSLSANTETDVDLTVDTWNYVAFAIEDREKAQVVQSYRLQDKYAKNAAYTAAATLEDALINLMKSFSTTTGASTTNIADSNILAAISAIEEADIDSTECAFFFAPAVFYSQIYALDKFTSNDFVDGKPAFNGKKLGGMLYGIPVYITSRMPYVNSTTGRYGALAHPSALAWAALNLGGVKANDDGSMTAKMVRVQSQYKLEYLSTLVVADLCFGVIENRDEAGVTIITKA